MYPRTLLTTLLTSSILLISPTIATPLHRRDPAEEPMCTGRGIGLRTQDYREMINQIDITIDYDVPWSSTSLASGRPRLPSGKESMYVLALNGEGGGSLEAKKITGLTLQYQLGFLNNLVNDNQAVCWSKDGSYTYDLGFGISST